MRRTTQKIEVGMVFGSRSVISEAPRSNGGHRRLHCLCVCGDIRAVEERALNSGHSNSCGCIAFVRVPRITHGMTGTAEYCIWNAMLTRCNNEKSENYKNYGGRGIKVCERWRTFANFIADMGHKPTPTHTLDRRDNNKGYSPDNCRWATRKEQSRNSRRCKYITFAGRTMVMLDWCELLGVPYYTVRGRMRRGWPFVEAVTRPRGTRLEKTI